MLQLVAKFVDFYNRLSEMICRLGEYLAPLEGFSRNANDGNNVQEVGHCVNLRF
jgi:hypothetical protein